MPDIGRIPCTVQTWPDPLEDGGVPKTMKCPDSHTRLQLLKDDPASTLFRASMHGNRSCRGSGSCVWALEVAHWASRELGSGNNAPAAVAPLHGTPQAPTHTSTPDSPGVPAASSRLTGKAHPPFPSEDGDDSAASAPNRPLVTPRAIPTAIGQPAQFFTTGRPSAAQRMSSKRPPASARGSRNGQPLRWMLAAAVQASLVAPRTDPRRSQDFGQDR